MLCFRPWRGARTCPSLQKQRNKHTHTHRVRSTCYKTTEPPLRTWRANKFLYRDRRGVKNARGTRTRGSRGTRKHDAVCRRDGRPCMARIPTAEVKSTRSSHIAPSREPPRPVWSMELTDSRLATVITRDPDQQLHALDEQQLESNADVNWYWRANRSAVQIWVTNHSVTSPF